MHTFNLKTFDSWCHCCKYWDYWCVVWTKLFFFAFFCLLFGWPVENTVTGHFVARFQLARDPKFSIHTPGYNRRIVKPTFYDSTNFLCVIYDAAVRFFLVNKILIPTRVSYYSLSKGRSLFFADNILNIMWRFQ